MTWKKTNLTGEHLECHWAVVLTPDTESIVGVRTLEGMTAGGLSPNPRLLIELTEQEQEVVMEIIDRMIEAQMAHRAEQN